MKENNYAEIIKKLSILLDEPESTIKERVEKNKNIYYPIVLTENLDKEKAISLESEFSNLSEIKIQQNSQRQYVGGPAFAHVLGYLGKVTQEEVDTKKYFLDDYIGRTGIEENYENQLRGTYGEELTEVDSLGKSQKVLATKNPIPGNDLTLSIDSELQNILYQSLKSKLSGMNTSKAAAVAMDPRNGKILALVSLPSYDNNGFINEDSEYIAKLFQDKNQPLFNRAISGGYPSGSTIKPMLAAAALQENIIDPNKNLFCPGYINLYDKSGNIYWTYKDWKAHGMVNMIKAIAESCDVYFYTIGGGYGSQQGLGISNIKKYLELFGWGQKTGIDLPEEKAGFVPDDIWKKQTTGQDWFIGDTYNTSIGQGGITVSPLQLTSAIAAIANGGKLFQPQLLQDAQPKIIREDFIEQKYLDIVRRGMREAVVSGTATSLNSLPVEVAGKTGTAETYKGKIPHAWFTAFAPYKNPEIVISVLIENGSEEGGVTVAVTKEVLNWYFNR